MNFEALTKGEKRDAAPGSRGVIYVATGQRHLDEMLQSVRSLKKHMPALPVVLFTDQKDFADESIDDVREIHNPRHSFMDKIAPLCETPFERTLFLDTDTLVCAPIDDLFDVLDRYDLAVTHAPYRHDRPFSTPVCFAEMNTGVVTYRRSTGVCKMFRLWLDHYEREVAQTGKLDSDQPAFRAAAYESPDVSLYILPSEYNLRTVMPAAVGRGGVRIIHGRARDMHAVGHRVNASRKIRIIVPDVWSLVTSHFVVLGESGRLLGSLLDLVLTPWVRLEASLRPLKRKLFSKR